ncbi:YobI family P-loop NTPase [Streptococcus intermedius]|uniref:YobI family P-loop NTPase n=1 Tax=Streptococcus intermedius TaxID=1338 RepID=UPI0035E3E9AD
MDFAIDNKDIRNIAISGSYSVGKSSFIESYKLKNRQFTPIQCILIVIGNRFQII